MTGSQWANLKAGRERSFHQGVRGGHVLWDAHSLLTMEKAYICIESKKIYKWKIMKVQNFTGVISVFILVESVCIMRPSHCK